MPLRDPSEMTQGQGQGLSQNLYPAQLDKLDKTYIGLLYNYQLTCQHSGVIIAYSWIKSKIFIYHLMLYRRQKINLYRGKCTRYGRSWASQVYFFVLRDLVSFGNQVFFKTRYTSRPLCLSVFFLKQDTTSVYVYFFKNMI